MPPAMSTDIHDEGCRILQLRDSFSSAPQLMKVQCWLMMSATGPKMLGGKAAVRTTEMT